MPHPKCFSTAHQLRATTDRADVGCSVRAQNYRVNGVGLHRRIELWSSALVCLSQVLTQLTLASNHYVAEDGLELTACVLLCTGYIAAGLKLLAVFLYLYVSNAFP